MAWALAQLGRAWEAPTASAPPKTHSGGVPAQHLGGHDDRGDEFRQSGGGKSQDGHSKLVIVDTKVKLQERMMALPDTVADVIGIGATFVSFSMVGVWSTHTHTPHSKVLLYLLITKRNNCTIYKQIHSHYLQWIFRQLSIFEGQTSFWEVGVCLWKQGMERSELVGLQYLDET